MDLRELIKFVAEKLQAKHSYDGFTLVDQPICCFYLTDTCVKSDDEQRHLVRNRSTNVQYDCHHSRTPTSICMWGRTCRNSCHRLNALARVVPATVLQAVPMDILAWCLESVPSNLPKAPAEFAAAAEDLYLQYLTSAVVAASPTPASAPFGSLGAPRTARDPRQAPAAQQHAPMSQSKYTAAPRGLRGGALGPSPDVTNAPLGHYASAQPMRSANRRGKGTRSPQPEPQLWGPAGGQAGVPTDVMYPPAAPQTMYAPVDQVDWSRGDMSGRPAPFALPGALTGDALTSALAGWHNLLLDANGNIRTSADGQM